MAAPNVNGRLHLTGVHQKPQASFDTIISYDVFYDKNNMKKN